MRRFRLSISWLMFAVSLLAVNFALLRAPGGRDAVSLIKITGVVFMADILAIGLFRVLTRCGESHPRLVRFEISALVVVLFYVLSQSVIHAFQRGETPEGIVQSYTTLSLPDVDAVASYYLANPGPIDAYLSQCDARAAEIRQKIEASQPPRENLRELIMARARAKGLVRDQTGE